MSDLREIFPRKRSNEPFGVTVVYGGQAGSEGKGAIVGYLARRYRWGAAVSTFMPNAGHTFVDGDETVVVTQLPVALVNPDVRVLCLGAGSAINVDQLEKEIEQYDSTYGVASRLRIHPRAVIVTQEDRDWEAENLSYIASTAKGCASSQAKKSTRHPGVTLARDVKSLQQFIDHDMTTKLNGMVNTGAAVLLEQSQGFDLGLNHGFQYPYCTSRNTGPDQICADVGLSASLVTNRVAVIRTNPIRVGNTDDGHSGEYGSNEIDWDTVSGRVGRKVEEITTVTKRVRRVFEFDHDRIGEMSFITRPTQVALTFGDYVDPAVFEKTMMDFIECDRSMSVFSSLLTSFIYNVERSLARPTGNTPITLLKTGPDNSHTIDLGYRV